MSKVKPIAWGLAIVTVAVLNILDVLPDWTTFAAILTLPFMAASTGMRCAPKRRGA